MSDLKGTVLPSRLVWEKHTRNDGSDWWELPVELGEFPTLEYSDEATDGKPWFAIYDDWEHGERFATREEAEAWGIKQAVEHHRDFIKDLQAEVTRLGGTEQSKREDDKPKGYPEGWPPIHNASHDPCDMLRGPCVCGAWHRGDDQIMKAMRVALTSQVNDDRIERALKALDKSQGYGSDGKSELFARIFAAQEILHEIKI